MARDFFRAQKGLHVTGENSDTGVHYLHGSGAPGSQDQENNAEMGSLYNDTGSGFVYRKKAAGSGTDKWSKLASIEDITGISWRSEIVDALTSTAAPVEGGTIDLGATPLGGDDAPELLGADFVEGHFILFGSGGTEVLGKIDDITGDVLTITYLDFDPLAENDTFIVKNYLPDSPDDQEAQAIVTFNGTDYIKIGDVNWDMATGINLSSGYAASAGNPSSSDTVESAIEKLDGNLDAVNSLSGVAQGATNLGTFSGDIISDNQTIKGALQELETDLDAIQTLSGVADAATHLGSFTGVTIPDDQNNKQALQALETHAERGFLEKSATNITTTTTVDEVLVDDVSAVEWTVMYELASDPARRIVEKIVAVHNGTPSADATNTDDNAFSVIRVGTAFNRTSAIDLNGTGAGQTMRLRVGASGAINVRTERRVIKAA